MIPFMKFQIILIGSNPIKSNLTASLTKSFDFLSEFSGLAIKNPNEIKNQVINQLKSIFANLRTAVLAIVFTHERNLITPDISPVFHSKNNCLRLDPEYELESQVAQIFCDDPSFIIDYIMDPTFSYENTLVFSYSIFPAMFGYYQLAERNFVAFDFLSVLANEVSPKNEDLIINMTVGSFLYTPKFLDLTFDTISQLAPTNGVETLKAVLAGISIASKCLAPNHVRPFTLLKPPLIRKIFDLLFFYGMRIFNVKYRLYRIHNLELDISTIFKSDVFYLRLDNPQMSKTKKRIPIPEKEWLTICDHIVEILKEGAIHVYPSLSSFYLTSYPILMSLYEILQFQYIEMKHGKRTSKFFFSRNVPPFQTYYMIYTPKTLFSNSEVSIFPTISKPKSTLFPLIKYAIKASQSHLIPISHMIKSNVPTFVQLSALLADHLSTDNLIHTDQQLKEYKRFLKLKACDSFNSLNRICALKSALTCFDDNKWYLDLCVDALAESALNDNHPHNSIQELIVAEPNPDLYTTRFIAYRTMLLKQSKPMKKQLSKIMSIFIQIQKLEKPEHYYPCMNKRLIDLMKTVDPECELDTIIIQICKIVNHIYLCAKNDDFEAAQILSYLAIASNSCVLIKGFVLMAYGFYYTDLKKYLTPEIKKCIELLYLVFEIYIPMYHSDDKALVENKSAFLENLHSYYGVEIKDYYLNG